ncbi:hypothetical protein HJC23_000894 [Cyclotella cryptica]|uniref:Uncharacterized protein n=1 Tax=Cyclotella cryptica TaxID=29204 RepID=A0ABD3PTH4_9STRA
MESSSEATVFNGPCPCRERRRRPQRKLKLSSRYLPLPLVLCSCTTALVCSQQDSRHNEQGQQRQQDSQHRHRHLALINTNPFLPDYTTTTCKNDKAAESWMTAVPVTAEACCKQYFSWNLQTCEANSNAWALLNSDSPQDVTVKYWADTTEGICKVDGPSRPSWVSAMAIPYETCCSDYLSWSLDKCLAAKPVDESAVKYYPDSTKGYCREDGPSRPLSIRIVEDDYTSCCQNNFPATFDKCMEKNPADGTTLKPSTTKPTAKTTPSPVAPIYFTPAPEASSPTTPRPSQKPSLRPTPRPTTNVDCDDPSLSKSQCESNPKCVWYLKNGIACAYAADVTPTSRPTRPPSNPPVKQYEFYNSPSDGLCKFNDDKKPAWITDIYTDYDTCCQKESWDVAKCLAAKPPELKEMEMQSSPTGNNDGVASFVIINVTAYGSLTLNNLSLPPVTDPKWNDLKRVLTKSLILTLAADEAVHPNVEVELWSIGTQTFSWRRLEDSHEEEKREEEDGGQGKEETSLLPRGDQVERRVRKKDKPTNEPTSNPTNKPTEKPNKKDKTQTTEKPTQTPTKKNTKQTTVTAASYPLKFAVVVPTKCDTVCQSSNNYLGKTECEHIANHLQEYIANNYFGVQLKREGKAVGLFQDTLPIAVDATLTYRFAAKSSAGLTWTPSMSPTYEPTASPTFPPSISSSPTASGAPTSSTYYPDYENHICKNDDAYSEFELNFFKSLEECCHFDWIDYDHCMEFSFTNPPTPRPSKKPSKLPTKKPTTKRPSPKPTRFPTMQPIKPNSAPIGTSGVIYYPDLVLRVCKSDGKQGSIPYQFSTPEACCKNNYMDYDVCMAYAVPKKYIPNPWVGYCQIADGTEISIYIYNSPEECCDTGMVGDYDTCLTNTLNQSAGTGSPTKHPTPKPVATSSPGNYYPDFSAGYCRSDGQHEDKPYVFTTAEKCCRNAVMNYDSCLSLSIEHFGDAPQTTQKPTNKPTEKPSPRPTINPTTAKLTSRPTTRPSPSPTVRPISSKPSATQSDEPVYYPDLVLRVCKSDGKQGNLPYKFSTAEACCDNNYMDYDVCMAYAEGQKYVPYPINQYCRVSDGSEPIIYIYDSLEDCCDSGMMGDYDNCVSLSIEQLGNSNGVGSSTSSTVYGTSSTVYATASTAFATTTIAAETAVPTTSQPSQKPTSGKPTLKPTVKYTVPPGVSSAIDARQFTDEVTDGFEKGLNGVFPWSTSTDNPWTIDKTTFNQGTASARSSPVAKGETSDLYVAVNSDFGGTFFFSMKSDVRMPYSGFYINVDDKSQLGYTYPTSNWVDLTVTVEPGQHVLMFRTWAPSSSYSSSSTSSGTVNIDSVSFQPHLIENFESRQLTWKALAFVGADWTFDINNPHGGTVSLRSPTLSSGQSSKMSFEFTTFTKGSSIQFWYDANISSSDKFSFLIDGYAVLDVTSSTGEWKSLSKSLAPGKHTMEWKFNKSGSGTSAVWIDDIRILPIGVN